MAAYRSLTTLLVAMILALGFALAPAPADAACYSAFSAKPYRIGSNGYFIGNVNCSGGGSWTITAYEGSTFLGRRYDSASGSSDSGTLVIYCSTGTYRTFKTVTTTSAGATHTNTSSLPLNC